MSLRGAKGDEAISVGLWGRGLTRAVYLEHGYILRYAQNDKKAARNDISLSSLRGVTAGEELSPEIGKAVFAPHKTGTVP